MWWITEYTVCQEEGGHWQHRVTSCNAHDITSFKNHKHRCLDFMVTPCINNIHHFIYQVMHTTLKNVELLKHFKIRKLLQNVSVYKETIIRESQSVLSYNCTLRSKWIRRARTRRYQCYGCMLWPVRCVYCALCEGAQYTRLTGHNMQP